MTLSVLHHNQSSGYHELGVRYCVYLPASYGDSKEYYNTLYLLHGAGDDEYGWISKGKAFQIFDEIGWEASIVVMPLGFLNRTQMNDRTAPSRAELESFWFEELVPSVAQNYRVRQQAQSQAIAGLSMGAEQALDLAASARGTFSALGCFSPVLAAAPIPLEALTYDTLRRRWPYLDHERQPRSLRYFYLVCADKDHLSAETSRKLASALAGPLSSDGLVSFDADLELPGFHEWSVWRHGLKAFLQGLGKLWHQPITDGGGQ